MLTFKYIAAAKDEENISSCQTQKITKSLLQFREHKKLTTNISPIKKQKKKLVLQFRQHRSFQIESERTKHERTCETEIPKDRNFSAYWERDFKELLVTKTSFLPLARSISRVCGTPSMSSSPFQITPDQCERATWHGSISAKMLFEMEWAECRERERESYEPSQSKRKASRESKRSLQLRGDRGCGLIEEEEESENEKGVSASLLFPLERQQ